MVSAHILLAWGGFYLEDLRLSPFPRKVSPRGTSTMQLEDLEHQLLNGYRILDLTICMAGPYCTKLLANYGADVIKIEPPGVGDPARRVGPFAGDLPGQERSLLFYYLNCDKKGVTLDLSTSLGRDICRRLVQSADAVVESFPPGTMQRLGLDFATLESWKPGIVLTSISNFGQTGPYRDYRASHIVLCGYGAWNHGVGEPDGSPVQCGWWVTHYVAGATASLATLAALWHWDATGQGQHIDLSAMEAVVDASGYTTGDYAHRCIPRARTLANAFPGVVPCADGWVGLNALSYRNWVRLCQLMDREDLLEDHRFDTSYRRRQNGPELLDTAIPWAIDRSKGDILKQGQEMGATVALVCTAQDILDLPHHQERNYFYHGHHPEVGQVTTPGYPFRVLTEADLEPPRWDPAPTLGQHNSDILCGELGYTREELLRLRWDGVI